MPIAQASEMSQKKFSSSGGGGDGPSCVEGLDEDLLVSYVGIQ